MPDRRARCIRNFTQYFRPHRHGRATPAHPDSVPPARPRSVPAAPRLPRAKIPRPRPAVSPLPALTPWNSTATREESRLSHRRRHSICRPRPLHRGAPAVPAPSTPGSKSYVKVRQRAAQQNRRRKIRNRNEDRADCRPSCQHGPFAAASGVRHAGKVARKAHE